MLKKKKINILKIKKILIDKGFIIKKKKIILYFLMISKVFIIPPYVVLD